MPPNKACTQRWGTVRLFKNFSGFESILISCRIQSRPLAANASRKIDTFTSPLLTESCVRVQIPSCNAGIMVSSEEKHLPVWKVLFISNSGKLKVMSVLFPDIHPKMEALQIELWRSASTLYGMIRTTQDSDIVAEMRIEYLQPFVSALQGEFYLDDEMIAESI